MRFEISYLIVFVVLISCVIKDLVALKCYQCNSNNDANCSDINGNNETSKYLVECPSDVRLCRKQYFYIVRQKSHRVVRSCGLLSENNQQVDMCRLSDSGFIYEKVCQCFKDACNGVETAATSFMSFHIMLVTLGALYFGLFQF